MNYQQELDKLIETLDGTPTLLLHSCCAPCSSYVISYLSQYFKITVFYYNPNIFPQEEYEKRKAEQRRFISEYNAANSVSFLDCDYDSNEFSTAVSGLENEPEGGKRCEKCFFLRLSKTAAVAENEGFDYFATTLTVSPHKNAEIINGIGLSIPCRCAYVCSDFKKREGYKKSIQLSKQFGLYRQNYCGCQFSKL